MALVGCVGPSVPETFTETNRLPKIYPDYTDVTIPINMAPLTFQLDETADRMIARYAVGDDEIIKCRPADLLEPEFEGLKEKYKDIAKCDEDVLSLALFEAVATEFLKKKYNPQPEEKDEVVEFNLYV